jgi:molybdopterin-biosynthesis enzyme MoeA-like protein
MKFLFIALISFNSFASVYTVKSKLPYLKQVAKVSECVIRNEDFLKEIEAFPKFSFTDKTSKEVADSIRKMKSVVISSYKTKNPFSSAIATTYPSNKTTVYFNSRKNPREFKEMINTAIHEPLHLIGFSHGDNSPIGKENSVNYRVGKIAESYVEKCNKQGQRIK